MTVFGIIGGVMIGLAVAYAVVLIIAIKGLLRRREEREQFIPEPLISVIIPVRNEAATIAACLRSMAYQDIHRDRFEVLISDDGSEDDTVMVVEQTITGFPDVQWVLLTTDEETIPAVGKKSAIERAIARSRGSLILTTDADTRRGSGWLSSFSDCYCRTGARMILGPVTFAEGKTYLEKIQTLEFLGIMGVTMGFTNSRIPVMCNGANLCYTKTAFEQVEGFSGNRQLASGDDQFLLDKIVGEYGGKEVVFLSNREAIVEAQAASTWPDFFAQRLRWVSKSRGYRRGLVLGVGGVIYVYQVSLFAGLFAGFLHPSLWLLTLGLIVLKWLADFPVVLLMVRFFRKKNCWQWYIPAQLFQLIYTSLMVPLAFLVPVRWKGRKI